MVKTCCFAGRSKYEYNKMTREDLKQTIDLLIKLGVTEFMAGNYGNFDRLCASVLKEMKKSVRTFYIPSFLYCNY